MKRATLVLVILALVLCGVGQSRADLILYDNGPINGAHDGYYVDGVVGTYGNNGAATDSFTVARASTLTSATVGLWVADSVSGRVLPQSIDFSIGTSPFGTDINNGSTSLLSSTFHNGNSFGSVYTTTLNGLYTPGLQPGTTYWFTLYSAVPSSTGWDVNSGPSQAQWEHGIGTNTGASNSFTLYGAQAPEPSSLFLAVTASVTGLGYLGWRRKAKAATMKVV